MTKITERLSALPDNSQYFSLEFFPPKTQEGFANLLPRLHRLARLKPLFTTVTWGAGGSTATRSLDLAEYIQTNLGLPTCLHLTCTNMRRRVLDSALDRCVALGIRNVLALRGDEPRDGEYDLVDDSGHDDDDAAAEPAPFRHAVDLVRYIRQRHGDLFCIGVAAYPEGHASTAVEPQSPAADLPFLVDKTRAGADFIMTQLFYDVDAFLAFEQMLRMHDSGVFATIPIIPGLMPVQSWGILTRTTKLACTRVPQPMMAAFQAEKDDDARIKALGVDVLAGMVSRITDEYESKSATRSRSRSRSRSRAPLGFHFYTLNLEKAVAQILERCALVSTAADDDNVDDDDADAAGGIVATNGTHTIAPPTKDPAHANSQRRRLSSQNSSPRNRVVVAAPSPAGDHAYEALQHEAGVPHEARPTAAHALAISEGEGALGRAATWDDYPNGRWGDARSPAYGVIDGYGPSLNVAPAEALRLWSVPSSKADVGKLFSRFLRGELAAIPWSEEALSPETGLIRDKLLALNERGWWSVASQPAVDAVRSDDRVVGWGPRVGGWVWQKPFVEIFVPSADWSNLKKKLQGLGDEVTYFAGNAAGAFEASDDASINPVTWGVFRGKEIITPTQIDALSFRAWLDEAFALWRAWQRLYAPGSAAARVLQETRADVWLVNVVGHRYQDGGAGFWASLLEA